MKRLFIKLKNKIKARLNEISSEDNIKNSKDFSLKNIKIK